MGKSLSRARVASPAPRATAAAAADRPETSHRWTFLSNHAHVLVLLNGSPGLVLREVARQVGITERAVQRIVRDLEDGGYLERAKVGRTNRYCVVREMPLRHPIESHRRIGDLLALLVEEAADRGDA
jgi:uncharacterized membrane protein